MKENEKYIFTSDRLGFRAWENEDIDPLYKINSDLHVMAFFPRILTKQETTEFVERMQNQLADKGYCYYAVDNLENTEFIGFIGLSYQTYEADFTPCVDIGWRIKSSEWNKGFATEGAKRCLDYALNKLKIATIYSIAPKLNIKSEYIMKKIGMIKQGEFIHPLLADYKDLQNCVVYKSGV